MKPEILRALVAAGATGEMIVAAVEAEAKIEEAKKAEGRAKAAERQRRKRAADAESNATSRDVTQTERDNGDVTRDTPAPPASPSSSSPTPPLITTLSPSTPPKLASLAARSCDESADDWPKDFRERFWEAYPRRTEKQAAFKALERIRKRGDVTFGALMAGVVRYSIAMRGTEPRYVKQPPTWLNAGCWDDDPSALANARAGPQPNGNTFLDVYLELKDQQDEHGPRDTELDLEPPRH